MQVTSVSSNSGREESKKDIGLPPVNLPLMKSTKISEQTPSQMLAWCSAQENRIRIVDVKTREEYANFEGARLGIDNTTRGTHVKKIPNTSLLVSLNQGNTSAKLEIYDISKQGHLRKLYFFETALGGTGNGDLTYNPKRSMLAALCDKEKIAYHLYTLCGGLPKADDAGIKLRRKTKWQSQNKYFKGCKGNINGLAFDPHGKIIATIDEYGACLISDVTTNKYCFHLDLPMGSQPDPYGRCKWSTIEGDPLLFIKYNGRCLNILDVEKQTLTLKNPIELENSSRTHWIDVCQNDGNLLAAGGEARAVKIYDRRESKIVKTFEKYHLDTINCVGLNATGDIIASASSDMTVKLWDVKTGKVVHLGATADRSEAQSVCFF